MPRSPKRLSKYPHRFFGRRLVDLLDQKIEDGIYSSRRDAAAALGYKEQRLAEWVNGHNVPDSSDELLRLTTLGISLSELEEEVLTDQLDLWRENMELDTPELLNLARKIQKAGPPRPTRPLHGRRFVNA